MLIDFTVERPDILARELAVGANNVDDEDLFLALASRVDFEVDASAVVAKLLLVPIEETPPLALVVVDLRVPIDETTDEFDCFFWAVPTELLTLDLTLFWTLLVVVLLTELEAALNVGSGERDLPVDEATEPAADLSLLGLSDRLDSPLADRNVGFATTGSFRP